MTNVEQHPDSGTGAAGRATTLLLTGVIVIALVGFVVGIGDRVVPSMAEPRPVVVTSDDGTLPSMTYAQVGEGGVRRASPVQSIDGLRDEPVVVVDMPITSDEADRRVSLNRRSMYRAYNGAPPVIPHAVDQLDAKSCMACHGKSVRIGDRVARDLPHPAYAQCTQCHAPPSSDVFVANAPMNRFDGVAAPWEGERAWVGAPPTVPHTTWMRDNCLACHGLTGWPGMETTHPWRQNCLQCHAPSARFDQAITSVGPSLLAPLDIVEAGTEPGP